MEKSGVWTLFEDLWRPRGRIGRMTFLISTTLLAVFNNIVFWLADIHTWLAKVDRVSAHVSLFNTLLVLGLAWPMVMLTVKRFHDLDKSGSWVLVPVAAIVMAIVAMAMSVGMQAGAARPRDLVVLAIILLLAMVGIGLLCTWQCLQLYCFKGTAGDNRFGPAPRLAHEMFGGDEDAETARALQAQRRAAEALSGTSTTPVTRVARSAGGPVSPRTGKPRPAGFGVRGR